MALGLYEIHADGLMNTHKNIGDPMSRTLIRITGSIVCLSDPVAIRKKFLNKFIGADYI